ncbi:hypothetical protein BGW36DRAFT_362999 [Talaromyces proteolyticus]|uniref:Uncharacterized protein n=1 Tax=Talaromyces proteolyticus TaxID=1131652 RepID=A0AAD4PW02_9EURO|nr:uncharacterized protein BGW36DRAFT_362999 [Talaromyces proteolyticus]KAH8691978.1 hypothetical protein BGW36DRAFT_362999 [Talaromyces proteolyticus]
MPPSPTKHLFDCLIKGYTTALQLNAILLKERYDLRVAIQRQKTKRTIKGRVLNMPRAMGVSEAQEITAAALAHPEASQIPNLEALEGRRRALPTCSNCKLVGHIRTYCPTRPT